MNSELDELNESIEEAKKHIGKMNSLNNLISDMCSSIC